MSGRNGMVKAQRQSCSLQSPSRERIEIRSTVWSPATVKPFKQKVKSRKSSPKPKLHTLICIIYLRSEAWSPRSTSRMANNCHPCSASADRKLGMATYSMWNHPIFLRLVLQTKLSNIFSIHAISSWNVGSWGSVPTSYTAVPFSCAPNVFYILLVVYIR